MYKEETQEIPLHFARADQKIDKTVSDPNEEENTYYYGENIKLHFKYDSVAITPNDQQTVKRQI